MKAIATMAAAAALLALSACDRLGIGGGGDSANASTNASANASGDNKDGGGNEAAGTGSKDLAGGATQASAGGGAPILDRAYVSGRWTDNGDCSVAVEFGMDGQFRTVDGGFGLWNLDGDALTMSGGGGTRTLRIVLIDQNTMNVVNPDGSLGRSTRC